MIYVAKITPKGGLYYGDVNIGPFKVEIKFESGVWQFCPYYTDHPNDFAAIEMNAMIRSVGRIWTAVPEGEIPKLKSVLGVE